MMTDIFSKTYPSTLAAVVDNAEAGQVIEAWTFDDAQSRRAAEKSLSAKGVQARLRSAYKPLVCAFREEIDLDGVNAVEIFYPVHPAAPANRFRLEAYPLAAMLGERDVSFTARSDDALHYDVRLTGASGVRELKVLAPNRVHQDVVGETNLSPTGWIIRGEKALGEPLVTDYAMIFDDCIKAVSGREWGQNEPYFEELNITVKLPVDDEAIGYGDEVMSLREALHEDLYFSLLEFFQKKSGRALGDRGLKPGQIVPEITHTAGEASVAISLRSLCADLALREEQPLDQAIQALAAAQIHQTLEKIGGLGFEAVTRSNRAVKARYHHGSDHAVMISAGQHANETTGVVGALRAATHLAARANAHFTISPLENPDGYQLHQRLCVDNPHHMHHAARYTALGDDLEYRSAETSGPHLNEKAIRFAAQSHSGAQLHVNLHGYPSHEWTRPLSGYTPRNFAMWTIPKGFFLIARHHQGWASEADAILDQITRRLGVIPGLLAYNEKQIALYEVHAGETGFQMVNGFPCLIGVDDRHDVPMTIITEYPDETIYGDAFIAGHEAQMQTVLSAYDAWQDILPARNALIA